MECMQELCLAKMPHFQMQCVESKLYAYIPLFPKIGVSLQWRGTVEVENAAMAQKSSSSSAVVTTLDGGQTVQRMLLNLWCAPDQELFNQGVYVLLALLESSLWSVKKNNPFNCLLIIASVSSLSKIFDLGPLGSEFHEATGFCQEGFTCSMGELMTLFLVLFLLV